MWRGIRGKKAVSPLPSLSLYADLKGFSIFCAVAFLPSFRPSVLPKGLCVLGRAKKPNGFMAQMRLDGRTNILRSLTRSCVTFTACVMQMDPISTSKGGNIEQLVGYSIHILGLPVPALLV